MKFLKKLFDHEYKELERFTALSEEVLALDEEMSKLSDEEKLNNVKNGFKKEVSFILEITSAPTKYKGIVIL